jgi:hypothetical protein
MTVITEMGTVDLAAIDDRLDRIINIDIGGRGVEHLFAFERERQGESLTGRAAQLLSELPEESVFFLTTGSVSRAWISPEIGENDGPAGAAVLVRALAMSKRATGIILAEATLIPKISSILIAAGVTVLPFEQALSANRGGTLLAATVLPFTTSDTTARKDATALLNEYEPSLLISIERTGRNADGIYCSMRGVDYGFGRARIDHVFDIAGERGIVTVAIGDGGNEIGMGNVTRAVEEHIPFGDRAAKGGAGIGAVTTVDALVTAACSNWGGYAVVAALAARLGDPRILHTASLERSLLARGVQIGLINAVIGIVDARVDNIAPSTHEAIVELLSAVVSSHL